MINRSIDYQEIQAVMETEVAMVRTIMLEMVTMVISVTMTTAALMGLVVSCSANASDCCGNRYSRDKGLQDNCHYNNGYHDNSFCDDSYYGSRNDGDYHVIP